MTEHTISARRWILPAGLLFTLLLLLALPPALVLLSGWPGSIARISPQPSGPIAPPPGPTGMSPEVIRWTLVFAALALGLGLGAWLLALLFKKEIGTGPAAPVRPRLYLLVLLGVVSLAVYCVNFLWPFSLQRYFNLKLISVGMIADRNGEVALGLALATLALFLLYGLAHRLCQGRNERRLWTVVLVGALLFAVANLYVSTITTLDPYDYIARGRITGVHGGNPYILAPKDYQPGDPFMDYVSWREATSAYGPLWETVSALTSSFAGDQLWANVLAYKGLAMLGYLLSTLLIAATLRRVTPQRALSGTLLFAWNPLILMEGIANGHNDLLMVALLLAAFWALSLSYRNGTAVLPTAGRGWNLAQGWLALILLAAAVLIKFVPILFFPLFLLYLLAQERSWPRWLGRALLLLIPVVIVVAAFYAVYWHWPEIANTVVRRTEMFRMSVASVAKETLQQHMDEKVALTIVRWPLLGAFVLGYLIILGRAVWTLGRPDNRFAYGFGLAVGSLGGALGGILWCVLGGWALLGENWGRALAGATGLSPAIALGIVLGVGLANATVFVGKHWQCGEKRPWNILLLACSSAFLLYLLLANFWFWPWYLVLPIALLALSGDDRLVAPLALAACAGELSHIGWNFVWYWWGISWDTVYQMDALVVFGMVAPALVVYLILSMRRPSPLPQGH